MRRKEKNKSSQSIDDFWKSVSEPSSVTKEDVERYLKEEKDLSKKTKDDQKNKERAAKASVEEVIREQQKKIDYQLAEGKGLSSQDVDIYNKLKEDVEEHRQKLVDVFSSVMENIEEKISMAWESGWSKGVFNIDHFINKYGDDFAGGNYQQIPWQKLDVYDRREFTKKLSLFPNKIRFRLLIDRSGSMSGNKSIEAMRLSVLMIEALKSFESSVNQRFRLSEEFFVDTEISVFSSERRSKIAKKFDSENIESDKQIERWKAIRDIGEIGGSTVNNEAWRRINNSIDYTEDLLNDKAMEFCFEITDGGVDNDYIAEDSRRLVDIIEQKGANVMGFIIGNSSYNDLEKFNKIWNDNTSEIRGFRVEDPTDLSEVILKRFSSIIQKKQIKISSEGDIED